MFNLSYAQLILILECALGCVIKIVFLISAVYSLHTNKHVGHYTKTKFKWSNSFFLKIVCNYILCINYFSFTLLETSHNKFHYLIFIFNAVVWFISFYVLYFEYIRKIPLQWFGLRSFWISNAIYYIIKTVIVIVYTCINNNNSSSSSSEYIKVIAFYVVQLVPSVCLFVMGVMRNTNTTNVNIINAINKELGSNSSNNNSNSNLHSLWNNNYIEINITEIMTNKYIRHKQNVLVAVNRLTSEGNNVPDKIKLQFNVKIGNDKSFFIKKTLHDVISFNNDTYTTLKSNDKNDNSTLTMQVKNITNILSKKGISVSKLKDLKLLYFNLMCKYDFFIDDFLMFCNINDNTIRNSIVTYLQQMHSHRLIPSNNSTIEYYNQDSSSIEYESKLIQPFEQNDVNKLMNFIMNVLSKQQAIQFKLINFKEKRSIGASELIYELSLNDKPCDELITLRINQLQSYFKHKNKLNVSKSKLDKLKQLLKDTFIINLRNKDSVERALFEKTINSLINDLFYFNTDIYNVFSLNKVLHLEDDEIDVDVINKFFQMEPQAYTNTNYVDTVYSKSECVKVQMENVVVNDKGEINMCIVISISGSEEDDKVTQMWKSDFYLTKMIKECKMIRSINSKQQRFGDVDKVLQMIIDVSEKIIIKGKNGEFNNNNKDIEQQQHDSCIDEFIQLLNELFYKNNRCVFYSPYFRKCFNIESYNTSKSRSTISFKTNNDDELTNYFKPNKFTHNTINTNNNNNNNNTDNIIQYENNANKQPKDDLNIDDITVNLLQATESRSILDKLLD